MTKPIQHYLPVKSKKQTLIQGRVPAEIVADAKRIMGVKGLSWAAVLTACLRRFNDDHGGKKNRAA